MTLNNVLIVNGILNKNSRIYTPEVMASIAEQINSDPRQNYGQFVREDAREGPIMLTRKDIDFTYKNAKFENNRVTVDIRILETPGGKILQELIDSIVFRTLGIGKLQRDPERPFEAFIGSDYTLTMIVAIPKSEDSLLPESESCSRSCCTGSRGD